MPGILFKRLRCGCPLWIISDQTFCGAANAAMCQSGHLAIPGSPAFKGILVLPDWAVGWLCDSYDR
jgi:hypothetical protein